MHAYYDAGVLMPLYFAEVFSPAVSAFAASRNEPIPFNLFQRLELENAIRQKVFRGEIDGERQDRLLSDVAADLHGGRLVLRPVNWIAALDKAREIGERVTALTGCRTLDLIHIALALQWGCSVFVTADERQAAAAKRQGLDVVDLRILHRRRSAGPQGPSAVKEPRSRYRPSKRPRRKSA